MILLNIFCYIMPVGLEKDLNPLGHSGQRRLQDVVGSIERLSGNPGWIGDLLLMAF